MVKADLSDDYPADSIPSDDREVMVSENSKAFESASELREAHAQLLEDFDQLLEDDTNSAGEAAALASMESGIRKFLRRGTATGIFLEDIKDRTACQVLLDYWVSSLSRAGKEVRSARLARFDGDQLPSLEDKACPYVGLDAFRDQTYFFGREADTRTLLDQIRGTALVVVIGASGSGKSSLVIGGVLPDLSAQGTPHSWRIAPTFVPGNAVMEHLAESVLTIVDAGDAATGELAASLRENPDKLADLLADPSVPPAVITIDQFEEVFTLSDASDREALVSNLEQLLEAGRDHRVVLTVREEFRSRIVALRGLERLFEGAWYDMRPMGYDELRAAVQKPAALVNLQFQSGIVDDLVKKVLGQPAALPLLQFALSKLWEAKDRNRVTWEVYRRVGNPLDALKASADSFYAGLAPQTRDEVKRILLKLVLVDNLLEAYRQPVRRQRLLDAGKANTEEVLELLAEKDYVRITPGTCDEDASVEVKHEALIRNWPLFVGWIDEKRIERRQRLALAHAAQQWANSGKPVEGLLTGWQLEEAKRHSDLSDLEREFVEAGAAAVERAQRRTQEALRREAEQAQALAQRERRLRWGFLLAAVVITILAVYFWERAEDLKGQQTKTQQELDSLQVAYKILEEERDKLFAKEVDASELLASQPTIIYLQISEEKQRPRAEGIARQLQENNIRVPGIERVSVPVARSEVRYFWPEDEKGAEEIIRLLDKYIGVDVTPTYVPGYEETAPRQQFEIWFAASAFPKTPDLREFRINVLADFKIDIYYDSTSPNHTGMAQQLEDLLTPRAGQVVLVPSAEKWHLKRGPALKAYEIRFHPPDEKEAAAVLSKFLSAEFPEVAFTVREVFVTPTPGTISILLFQVE